MKEKKTVFTIRKIILASMLFGAALQAYAAAGDKTVTFNVPVKLEKLDPQVTGFYLYCNIQGDSNFSAHNSTIKSIQGGTYAGMVSVAVTVPQADLGKVKTWQCYVRLSGPTAPAGVGPNTPGYSWAKAQPNTVDTVSGTF